MQLWKGWGVLAFIIPIICGLLMQLAVNSYFTDGFYKTAPWPIPLAIFIAAMAVFFIGQKLNRQPSRLLIDAETNQQLELKTKHSLFRIPMQYWGGILLLISTLMYFIN